MSVHSIRHWNPNLACYFVRPAQCPTKSVPAVCLLYSCTLLAPPLHARHVVYLCEHSLTSSAVLSTRWVQNSAVWPFESATAPRTTHSALRLPMLLLELFGLRQVTWGAKLQSMRRVFQTHAQFLFHSVALPESKLPAVLTCFPACCAVHRLYHHLILDVKLLGHTLQSSLWLQQCRQSGLLMSFGQRNGNEWMAPPPFNVCGT